MGVAIMAIQVNITKAKNITKDRLRNERTPRLEALDVEFIKAQEAGSDTSAIVAKKQQLRDAPASVDSMTTVEQLKAATLPDVGV
jgi:hypothetical protein